MKEERKKCREKGLVYDMKTKKCRPNKRNKKTVKKTISEIRKECREKGLVYDVKTKKCRERKRRTRAEPKFFDAWLAVHPNYSKKDYGEPIIPLKEDIASYIKKTGKITGDILYVGDKNETRQEYGIIVVDLDRKDQPWHTTEEFYAVNPSVGYTDKEIVDELKALKPLGKSEKAIKGFVKWHKNSGLFN